MKNCNILRDQTSGKLVDKTHESNCDNMRVAKMLDLLAYHRAFQPTIHLTVHNLSKLAPRTSRIEIY